MEELNKKLNKLHISKKWEDAISVVNELCNTLGITITDEPYLISDNTKINANVGRFEKAHGFIDRPATYEVQTDNKDVEVKVFWANKTIKTNLSWIVGISPNFEDGKTYQSEKYKIGIDIVIPKECDGITILVSNNLKVRSLELKEKLSRTDREILDKLKNLKNNTLHSTEDKKTYHNILWDAFNFEPINRKFYKELVDRFSVLREHLVSKGFQDQDAVMFSTRLIGRLLFVWFLRKKNLINEKVGYFELTDTYEQTKYYKERLEKLFFETLNTDILDRDFEDNKTPYLNGGLFEATRTDFYLDTKLSIPDGFFSQFYEVLSHYNFTVDESSPEFEQVAVDPEMLGRIFESLLAEQRTETGAQARKAKGAFYTPREIVSYMCEESLKEYLKSKIPDDSFRDVRIQEIVSMSESVFRDQDHNKRRDWKPYQTPMIKALDELTVFDPAVGSGAYPMGMLHLLVKVYTRLDGKYEKNISKLKRDILSRSLYGSDIEITAIEISRLRAWLSLVVDMEDGEQVAPLPNLEFHFVCANTLISLDSNQGLSDMVDRKKLSEIREKYYNTNSKIQKAKFKKDYEKALNSSNLSLLSNVDNQLKTYRPFDHESRASFFDPDLMFGIDKFDVVIGNPPYVGEKGHKEIFQPIAKSPLGVKFYQGKMDLFYFFFHIALDLLKSGGVMSYITTNYYVTATGAKKLREDIENRSDILSFINFGELKIFESALGQHNLITILQKDHHNKKAFTANVKGKGFATAEQLSNIVTRLDPSTEYADIEQKDLFKGGNIVSKSSELENILDKIKNNSNLLSSICKVNQGIVTGADKVSAAHLKKYNWDSKKGDGIFVLSDQESRKIKDKNVLKNWYKNSDANKWITENETQEKIIYGEDSGSSVTEHLEKFRENLEKRREVHKGVRSWYDLWRAREQSIFEGEKIVAPQRSKRNTFGYNNIPWYAASDVFFITQPKDEYTLKFLLGVLNSNLVYIWLYNRGKRKGEMLETIAEPLSKIPIPKINPQNKHIADEIEKITNGIVKIKSENKDTDTKDLEKEIDVLVYELYELTDGEIKIVEEKSK